MLNGGPGPWLTRDRDTLMRTAYSQTNGTLTVAQRLWSHSIPIQDPSKTYPVYGPQRPRNFSGKRRSFVAADPDFQPLF